MFESDIAAVTFLLGRVLYGGILAFMGLNHLTSRDDMTGYAAIKGVPYAGVLVPVSGLLLVAGTMGIVAGAYVRLAALLIVGFLLVVTPTMHDFWAHEGGEKFEEMVNFLKNGALLAAALMLFGLAGLEWPYAANVGVVP